MAHSNFRSQIKDGVSQLQLSLDGLAEFESSPCPEGALDLESDQGHDVERICMDNNPTGNIDTMASVSSHFSDGFGRCDTSTARTPRVPADQPGTSAYLKPPTFEDGPDTIYDAYMGFSRYCSYEPLIQVRGLKCCETRSSSYHANKLGSQLNIPGWLHELSYKRGSTHIY